MFYKLFKSYHPILVIIIPLAGISLWINSFIDAPDYTYFQFDCHQMPLYRLILSWFGNNILTTSIVSLSLIIIIGFLLVRLSTKYILLKERTYLPAFLYVVMVSGLPALQRINPAIIASLFLVFAIEKILDSYRKRGISYNYFEASFIISLGSLFYHDLIYLALYI